MPGEDPRKSPRPLAHLPALLAAGAAEFNAQRYWHAHEDWEIAWHALRAAGHARDAAFLQGMIVVAAGFENAKRHKEAGFRRQTAKGLALLRANREGGPALGVLDSDAWIERLTDCYLEAAAHSKFAWASEKGIVAPTVAIKAP